MEKRLIAAGILKGEGILLLVAAVIHVAVVPVLRRTLITTVSPADFGFI